MKLKAGAIHMARTEVSSQPAKANRRRGRRMRRWPIPRVLKAVISASDDIRLRPARTPIRTAIGTVKARMAGMR